MKSKTNTLFEDIDKMVKKDGYLIEDRRTIVRFVITHKKKLLSLLFKNHIGK